MKIKVWNILNQLQTRKKPNSIFIFTHFIRQDAAVTSACREAASPRSGSVSGARTAAAGARRARARRVTRRPPSYRTCRTSPAPANVPEKWGAIVTVHICLNNSKPWNRKKRPYSPAPANISGKWGAIVTDHLSLNNSKSCMSKKTTNFTCSRKYIWETRGDCNSPHM